MFCFLQLLTTIHEIFHNKSKQKQRQTRYGRDIPDYSGQESDQEYEPEKVRDMPY